MFCKCTRLIGAILITTALLGCDHFGYRSANSGTVSAVTAAIAPINTSNKVLQDSISKLTVSVDSLLKVHGAVEQFSADRIEVARYGNSHNPTPSPVTPLIEANLSAAATAIGLPPSPTAEEEKLTSLQLALSKSESDSAILTAHNQDLTNQANLLRGQTQLLTQQINEKEGALVAAAKEVDTKTSQLVQAGDQVKIEANQAQEARKQRDQEAAAKTRLETARWFMLAGGILIALGIVGLFIHIPDSWLASMAGASVLSVGWLLSYVEGLLKQQWFRYLMDGVVIIGIGAGIWFAIRAFSHKKAIISTNDGFQALVGAVEEAATKNPTMAAQLQPLLQQWLVTDRGVADQNVIDAINKMAAQLNLINPGQIAIASGRRIE